MDAIDFGVLVIRLVLGLTLAAHGLNKFFGGGRIPGTAAWFDSIGMKPGRFHAVTAAITETVAGLGLAAGLLTPIPAAGFVAVMAVAVWTVHRPHGFFITNQGWEYNMVLATIALAVVAIGPGRYSLDCALFGGTDFYHLLHGWCGLLIAVGLGLAGALGQLVIFFRPPVNPAG